MPPNTECSRQTGAAEIKKGRDLTRRQFARLVGLAGLGEALAACESSPTHNRPEPRPELLPTGTALEARPATGTSSWAATPKEPPPTGKAAETRSTATPTEHDLWGIFHGSDDPEKDLAYVREQTGLEPNFITTFVGWHGEGHISRKAIEVARSQNKTLIVFWEAYTPGVIAAEDSAYSCNEILHNKILENYIHAFAEEATTSGVKIILFPFPEPNGEWTPQCAVINGNSPQLFQDAFVHVKSFFDNAPNVTVGVALNANSVPDTATEPQNALSNYLPEDTDIIGIDGFNFGPPQVGWMDAEALFAPALKEINGKSKLIMISSTGCAPGEKQPEWITKAVFFFRKHRLPFNIFAENKEGTGWERNWNFLMYADSVHAFVKAMRQ